MRQRRSAAIELRSYDYWSTAASMEMETQRAWRVGFERLSVVRHKLLCGLLA